MSLAYLANAGDFMAPVLNTSAGSEYLRCPDSKQINNPCPKINTFPDVNTYGVSITIDIDRESLITGERWTLFDENIRL